MEADGGCLNNAMSVKLTNGVGDGELVEQV